MKKSSLVKLINNLIDHYSLDKIPTIVDKIKTFGFEYATRSGVTWSLDDTQIPPEKEGIVKKAKEDVATINKQFEDGLLSLEEKKRLVIEVWHKAKSDVEEAIPATIDAININIDIVRTTMVVLLSNFGVDE
jgi:DNA-directed RNA polymerase subunit beta'